jgi:UDP-N-acetylglucosamine 2-epimerase
LDHLVLKSRPDWILAQGDTTSVLAASLVAFYRRLRFGHVEAGLRTRDLQRPFPEEANRRIADLLATAYFAPTERARRTLLAEGVTDGSVWMTGNTVVDALLEVAGREYRWADGPLAVVPADAQLVLVTAHRRESFGQPFRDLCLAVRDLAVHFADQRLHVVYPVHLNPNVQRPVHELLSGIPNVTLLPPLDYLSLVQLMKRATLILTDSGGIQEEAPTFGVPTLVMRETTERPEAVEVGVSRLVGTARDHIVREATAILTDPAAQARIRLTTNPYGDGRAGERIVKALMDQTSGQ